MAYTVEQLITNSYYISQVVAREEEEVSGSQLSDALTWLNALLNLKSANTNLIPYYTQYTFNAVIGQEAYFIPNLVECETLTFNINNVRFSTIPLSRRMYWATSRVDNLLSLPYNYEVERCLGGSNLYLYFLPAAAYPMILWGKFGFESVSLNDDLTTTYELFYIDYLVYELSQRICSQYNIEMLDEAKDILKKYYDLLIDVSPPDLTLKKVSAFKGRSVWNWADTNVGHGWRPGT
jgi:hypothetical protein